MPASTASDSRPRIGVSACLLGQPVRFDGGHKRDTFITTVLCRHVDYTAFCPETAAGLGVPRPPIRLVGDDPQALRAVGVRDAGLDVTAPLRAHAEETAGQVAELDGFILKKDSPSCGLHRVKRYPEGGGMGQRDARGLFAAALVERFPELPMEEEGRLNDPVLRENFVNRVYVRRRWRALAEAGFPAAALVDFHARHKYLLMAHSAAALARLGAMLSNLSGKRAEQIAPQYFEQVMQTLTRRVSRKRHANVLEHLLGYLKRRIERADKAEMVDAIARYRLGEVPLIVPVTLFRHYFRVHPDAYVASQVYLEPHPDTLSLRNDL